MEEKRKGSGDKDIWGPYGAQVRPRVLQVSETKVLAEELPTGKKTARDGGGGGGTEKRRRGRDTCAPGTILRTPNVVDKREGKCQAARWQRAQMPQSRIIKKRAW